VLVHILIGDAMRIIWKCTECGSVQTSNSNESHKMDFCDCKCTALDLEEDYQRIIGYNTYEMVMKHD
jgi:hypothetical protein